VIELRRTVAVAEGGDAVDSSLFDALRGGFPER